MLDTAIHRHIDDMDSIEESLERHIDNIFKSIDIDEVIDDPSGSVRVIVDQIYKVIEAKFAEEAFEKGIMFARKIEGMREELKIPKSKNPNLNEASV